MTPADRDLLEKAAKAAGYEFEITDADAGTWLIRENGIIISFMWNPRENYGEALLLAVKLKIEMMPCDDNAVAIFNSIGYTEPNNDDAAAAMCRAIVRVAAAIGEGI